MPTIESIAPSLFVEDLSRSVNWYTRVLGFSVAWRAADHAGVQLGPALIILVQVGVPPAGRYKGACHLRLKAGVDDYASQIEAAGQPLESRATDRPEYGIREAHVRDPDGNDLYLGQPLELPAG